MYKFFKKNNIQIIRFFISGTIASIFNYLIYISLYFIFKNIIVASLSGYSVGILVSFIFSKIWVFQNESKHPIVKSFVLFCLIYLLGGMEMSTVITILNKLINNHNLASVFGALIASLNNYFGSKYLLFRK